MVGRNGIFYDRAGNDWDATIIRKLETLNGIYGKISDLVSARRMELLEWIVIILIGIEIVMPFFGRLFGH